MASDYAQFPVMYRNVVGEAFSVGPGVDVHVYDTEAEADVAESPLTTNADGEIEAGTLAAVDPDTIIIFRVENFNGMAFCVATRTT